MAIVQASIPAETHRARGGWEDVGALRSFGATGEQARTPELVSGEILPLVRFETKVAVERYHVASHLCHHNFEEPCEIPGRHPFATWSYRIALNESSELSTGSPTGLVGTKVGWEDNDHCWRQLNPEASLETKP